MNQRWVQRTAAPALVLAALGLQAAPVAGQIGGRQPAEIPDDPNLTPEQSAQITMNNYAACLVRRSRVVADRLAATLPASAEQDRLARQMSRSDCLISGELRFLPIFLRGGVFQEMYRRDFSRGPATDVSRRGLVDYNVGSGAPTDLSRNMIAILGMADCALRKDAIAARLLIMSPVAGTAEDRAFARLGPALNGCLVQGATVRFSRPVLRGAVAEALYRVSRSPIPSSEATH